MRLSEDVRQLQHKTAEIERSVLEDKVISKKKTFRFLFISMHLLSTSELFKNLMLQEKMSCV